MTIKERINVHYGKKFEKELQKLINDAEPLIEGSEFEDLYAVVEALFDVELYKTCGIFMYRTFHTAIKRTNKVISTIVKES